MDAMEIVIFVAIGVVFVILVLGIVNLFRTGEEARTRSNQLMRFRVIAQFVAVLLLMALLWWRMSHGGGAG